MRGQSTKQQFFLDDSSVGDLLGSGDFRYLNVDES